MISQREGLEGIAVPCKLYGVLAAGRAIVAAVPEGSEVASVVHEEGCGLVVPPSDPLAIATAIRRLITDPEMRLEMSRRAFKAYESKYSLAVTTQRFWRFWAKV